MFRYWDKWLFLAGIMLRYWDRWLFLPGILFRYWDKWLFLPGILCRYWDKWLFLPGILCLGTGIKGYFFLGSCGDKEFFSAWDLVFSFLG